MSLRIVLMGNRETMMLVHVSRAHTGLVETLIWFVCFRYDVISYDQLFNLRV